MTLVGSFGESSLMSTELVGIFDLRLFYLIFTSLIYVVLSKKNIYIHQIISLIASGFGMIIVISVKIICKKGGEINLLGVVIIIIKGFNHSLELVISKYIMDSLLVPPLRYLFISGIFKF